MSAENPKKLGFGLMRLPKRGVGIDVKQVSQMVDLFIEAGCTYFDTAHVYLGSEEAARKALVERYPRESYTLATKLYAPSAPTRKSALKQFETSLKCTGTGYIDYYLLHSLMGNNVGKYERMQLWDYVADLKARGLVRHVGFSFHDGPELLDKLLNEHPEVEFVQLQINYEDWENPSVTSRANYEVARAHDKKIVVMEPVKGGRLANPPAGARATACSQPTGFLRQLGHPLRGISRGHPLRALGHVQRGPNAGQPLVHARLPATGCRRARGAARGPADPWRLACHTLHELPVLHEGLPTAHQHPGCFRHHEQPLARWCP